MNNVLVGVTNEILVMVFVINNVIIRGVIMIMVIVFNTVLKVVMIDKLVMDFVIKNVINQHVDETKMIVRMVLLLRVVEDYVRNEIVIVFAMKILIVSQVSATLMEGIATKKLVILDVLKRKSIMVSVVIDVM